MLKTLHFYITLVISKLLYFALKFSRISSGTAIIGMIALKINPKFLEHCNRYISHKINVTGTNGKTTTSGLVSHLISKNHKKIINNAKGANMLTGIANSFAVSLNPFRHYDYSVIETDEGFLAQVYNSLDSDYLLVTNLFRDQLDRFGELLTTKKFIQDGIDKKKNITLLLNADDPLVASFEGGKNKIYYGVENVYYTQDSINTNFSVEEKFNCPCGAQLIYDKKFYAQQGHYHCNCGYKRPEVKYKADVTLYKDHSVLIINGEKYEVPLVGLFNAYNALAAISLCLELGIENIAENLLSFKVAFGRSEVKYLNGKRALIQLIKNPVGANEVLKTIDLNSNILIAINDNYADGRDVSWLWDANFECLKNISHEIVVSGSRADDMALRLKYAGVDLQKIRVIHNIQEAVNYIAKTAGSSITILPTYTVLLKINKMKIFTTKK